MATVTGTKRLLDISGNNITTAVSLEAEGTLLDVNGASGTSGQLLSSTGTGVDWVSNNSGSWDGIFSGSAQITGSLGVTGSYDQEFNSASPAAVIKNTNQNGSGLNIWAANGGGGTNTILKLGTSSETVKMVVIENGNVGIGTTNPGEKLQIDNGLFVVGDSSVSEQLVLGFDYLGGELGIFKKDTDELIAGMYENNYVYGSDPYNPYLFITGSNGNVGIGTTNPSAKLQVTGTSGYVLKTSGDIALTTYTGDTKIGMANNSLQLLVPFSIYYVVTTSTQNW